MNNYLSKTLIFSLILCLSGCSTNTPRQNQAVGATTGAAAGAALGANSGASPGPITLVGIGAILGALIGSAYVNPMEGRDKEKAFQAIASGNTLSWQNPDTKVSYTIIPAPNYVTFDGNPTCRKFTATQTAVDKSTHKIIRTACRGSHGSWALVH